ncbi:MAG: DNA methyltransferase [Candidatus Paceibacterota bacterium]|jgi:site-specific DNA-methyltransferase (adenine-specific)
MEYINKIITGNCLDIMKQMPDKSVDVILTDPPYGIDLNYDNYIDSLDNLKELVSNFMVEALRVSKVIVITPGINNIWYYPKADWVMCWYYGCGPSRCSWGFNVWQPILVYGKDPYLANGMGARPDDIKDNTTNTKNGHPCAKPITFIRKLLDRVSINKEDLILDPFCGSGTTCVAAKLTGKKYIGIDLSQKYCDIAIDRLNNTYYQPSFDMILKEKPEKGLF